MAALDNGETAKTLAATREDLARLEGVVITEIRGLKSDVNGVERGLSALDARLQAVERQLVAGEARATAVTEHRAQLGRSLDRWREWLAYLVTTVLATWNIWRTWR